MLRRRPDNTFEYQELERTLYASTPAPLSPERRDALRARVFSNLGAQDPAPRTLIPRISTERWVAIPVGAGVAATIIAATHYVLEQSTDSADGNTYAATAGGSVTVDGVVGSQARPGQLIKAESASWVTIGKNVSVGLEAGSSFTFGYSGDRLALLLNAGTHHVVSTESLLEVPGDGWTARMTGPGALDVSIRNWMTSLQALEGEPLVYHNGQVHLLRAGDPPLLIMNTPGSPGPANGGPGNGPASSGPSSPGGPSAGAASAPDPTGTAGNSGPAGAPAATGTPAAAPPAADPGTGVGAPASDPSATTPAGLPAGTASQGEGTPPEDPGYGSGNSGEGAGNTGEHPLGGAPGQGEGTPPAGEGSNAGGNSGENANPDSNAGGNSGDNPAPGNNNAGGNSGSAGSGSEDAPGNSEDSNAGGNSGDNANPDSNAGGNSGSTGSGDEDAPGNSEDSNAGGNSGSTGSGDEDAPGNSENSNAGGNSGKK